MNTIRVIPALPIIEKWKMNQVYVKNVFLNENFEEEVYMSMIPNFEMKRKCYKLKRPYTTSSDLVISKATFERLRILMVKQ